MRRASVDLTDLAMAARSNDPRVVSAFGERFPKARLHLPLAVLEGIRNRPETAVELGVRLPIHWLKLDNGEKAVPVFTSLAQCRECAERLDWETDNRSIKALTVPGNVALTYLSQVLVAPGVERAIVDPLGDAELHLARTEVEALAAHQPLYSLWFYSRNGKLKRPVRIEGASLLGTLLSKADRVLDAWTEVGPPPIPIPEPPDALEHMESRGPLGALASELYRVASQARVGTLHVTVTKSGGDVSLDARPDPTPELLARLRAAAERALASEPGDARLSFRIDDSSIVLSSSTALSASPEPTERSPRSSTRVKSYDYIPLEPEEAPENE